MRKTEPCIGVLPIGNVPEIVSKSIAAHIFGYLDLETDVLPALDAPAYAFDERRLQYDAGAILKSLESEPFQDYVKVIGLLDLDLFVPVFTHVFGEAKQGGKCALVSFYRLRKNLDGTIAPIPILLERTAKVALHESGHLLNLLHCTDELCVMHFSGTLEDLDNTPLYLCRYCSTYLKDALRRK